MKNIIYSTDSSSCLAESVSAQTGIPIGNLEWLEFGDGETTPKFADIEEPRNKNVWIVASAEDKNAFADIADLASAMRQELEAGQVHLQIPYLSYQTAERTKPGSGEISRGIYRVQSLFDTNPNDITFWDLHAEGIKNVGGRMGVARHRYFEPWVIGKVNEIRDRVGDVVLYSPDEGRAQWVESLGNKTGIRSGFLQKNRFGKDLVEVSRASRDLVDGKTVIQFDDMIRTGGTAIHGAESLVEAGAEDVVMLASHGIFPKNEAKGIDVEKKIEESVFSEVHVTNSHPRTRSLSAPKIVVSDISHLIAEEIQRQRL